MAFAAQGENSFLRATLLLVASGTSESSIKLVQVTWHQAIPEFPALWVGLTYLPIPIGGLLTSLFVIERCMTRKFFAEPEPETVSQLSTE